MPRRGWLIFLVIFVVMGVAGVRGANHNYTQGSSLFKQSDDNLEKDKHLDVSDYDYYKDGKFK